MARIPCSIEMYYKMVEIAAKYEISIAEVQVTLIRDSLEKLYGFGCKHKDMLEVHEKNASSEPKEVRSF